MIECPDESFTLGCLFVGHTDRRREDTRRLAEHLDQVHKFPSTDQAHADRRGPRHDNVNILKEDTNKMSVNSKKRADKLLQKNLRWRMMENDRKKISRYR